MRRLFGKTTATLLFVASTARPMAVHASPTLLGQAFDDLDGLNDLEALTELDGLEGATDQPHLEVRAVGQVDLIQESFLFDRALQSQNERIIVETFLDLETSQFGPCSAGGTVRAYSDLLRAEKLRRLFLNELFAYCAWGNFDILAGRFIEEWGVADVFNPIDVLNRRDFDLDVLDPVVRGETGARLRWGQQASETTHTLDQWLATVAVLPLSERSRFAEEGQRYALPGLRDAWASTPGFMDGILVAGRLEHTLNLPSIQADFQYAASRGPERFPNFVAREGVIHPEYYGVSVVGGGFRAAPSGVGETVIKAEFAHKLPYSVAGASAPPPGRYFQSAVGVEYSFFALTTSADQMRVSIEYLNEFGPDDLPAQLRPFRSDVGYRMLWEFQDVSDLALDLFGTIDLKSLESFSQLDLTRRLHELHSDLRLVLSGRIVAPATEGLTFLSSFPSSLSLVSVGVRYAPSVE